MPVARSFVTLIGFLSLIGPTSAKSEAVFKDWRVVCSEADTANSCQMLQSRPATTGGDEIFLLSISKAAEAQNLSAVISVPLGVYLAPGVEIHLSGQRPFKVRYEICDQSSCHAGFQLKGAVLRSFKRGSEAKFRIWTAKSKAVEFPVSLQGFTAGFADLSARIAQ